MDTIYILVFLPPSVNKTSETHGKNTRKEQSEKDSLTGMRRIEYNGEERTNVEEC